MQCDILIIGAGPAGSSAGIEAARQGLKVVLVDKRTTIGSPVQCAEFIPKLLLQEITVSASAIAQEITAMKTFLPDGSVHEHPAPGFILNRSIFDKELALQAAAAGALVLANARCAAIRKEKVLVVQNYEDIEISARLIIGADGPRSIVGTWIGQCNQDLVFAAQYELPLLEKSDCTEVYFSPDYFGGYGWVFPKGISANVGVAIKYDPKTCNSVYRLLDDFTDRLCRDGRVAREPVSTTAGLIPVGGPLKAFSENMMLAGDAAGHAHPISGAGIMYAVVGGRICGRVAAQAVKESDFGRVNDYEREWQRIYGSEFQRAVRARAQLEAEWPNLDRVIRKCWVAFKEYYE